MYVSNPHYSDIQISSIITQNSRFEYISPDSTISPNSQMTSEYYDAFNNLQTKEISNLLDGRCSVSIQDIFPRIIPNNYTPEYFITRAARVSYNLDLKTPKLDEQLVKYLVRNGHTTPLEMCNITFRLHIPKACSIHFLKHRTCKFNELSQRYTELPDSWYNIGKYENGIRLQDTKNRQGSVITNSKDINPEIIEKVNKLEDLVTQIHSTYKELLNLGLAKEVGRFYLPMGMYTTLYLQVDLNNFCKMMVLRTDEAAQHETRIIAKAMLDLVRPLFPVVIGYLDDKMAGMILTGREVEAVRLKKEDELWNKRELMEFRDKLKRLIGDDGMIWGN